MPHQTPAVREDVRAFVVPLSSPNVPTQFARAAANAVVVPFNYSDGQKQGGP